MPPIPEFFATAPRGMEHALTTEIRQLGAEDATERPGGVRFSGPLTLAYAACLWSRIANRVLLRLASFPAASPDALYRGVRTVDWMQHLAPTGTLAVDCNTRRSAIDHSRYAAQKVKDAVVDVIRDAAGTRPDVRLERPDVRLNVFIDRDEATLYLDLSGDSLHRRGYRARGVAAPLKENLAAAILVRAGWPAIARDGGALIDPMCGSGTLPIEAALIAADIAPGINRDYFGFLGWLQHDAAGWDVLKREAEARRLTSLPHGVSISGYDHDRSAVAAAIANVERAGLHGLVHVERRDVAAARPTAATGLLVANPPYGQRVGDADTLEALYGTLGETLRTYFTGWQAAVLTDDAGLGFRLGLRAHRTHGLYNGAIECRLLRFEVSEERFLTPRSPATHDRNDRRAEIAARAARAGNPSTANAEMFANRLRKNLRHTTRWARREAIGCYRVYDADLPEFAVAIDVYEAEERHVVVQEYQAPASVDPTQADARLEDALRSAADVLEVPATRMHLKVREKQRGAAQYVRQADSGEFYVVSEGAERFRVNFTDYLDTGLFIDHRLVRAEIRRLAPGRRFLNLFAYTGAATVSAVAGGAASSLTVDLSRTYLDWAARNFELNGIRGESHARVQADCLAWLDTESARPRAERDRFDLAFLNPPVFSNSKRMQSEFDVQRDAVDLIRQTAALLSPHGVLIFATNLRRFRLDTATLDGLVCRDISKPTLARDFSRRVASHHCWSITARVDDAGAS